MSEADRQSEIQKLIADIEQLEELKRSRAMPAALADSSIAALQAKIESYQARLEGDGAIAQGAGAKAAGQGSIFIEGDLDGDINLAPETGDPVERKLRTPPPQSCVNKPECKQRQDPSTLQNPTKSPLRNPSRASTKSLH